MVQVTDDDVGAVGGPVTGESGAEARGSAGYEDGETSYGGGVDGLGEVDRFRLNAVEWDIGCIFGHADRDMILYMQSKMVSWHEST